MSGQMIFTDRSRQETGTQHCERHRYLHFHAVNGYGIEAIGERLYLRTGIAIHDILADIMTAILLMNGGVTPKQVDTSPGSIARKQIRGFVRKHLASYVKDVRENGFYGVAADKSEVQELMLLEQVYNVEGLIWGFVRVSLPELLRQFEVVEVENEEELILGCTCGKGAQPWQEHDLAGCLGIVQQSRPDLLLRDRGNGQLVILDYKSVKAYDNRSIEKYRDSVQMAVGTVGVERRLKEPVPSYYVLFLIRGAVRGQYQPMTKTYDGPLMLQSDFCYIDYTPANPPVSKEIIGGSAPWYKRTPVWEIDTWQGKPAEVSSSEWLVDKMPLASLEKNFVLIGPYERQVYLIQSYLRQVEFDERRWTVKLTAIYEGQQQGRPLNVLLDENIPASWDCHAYGERCPMWKICHRDVPVEDPMTSGLFAFRVPHHIPEQIQMNIDARDQGIPIPEEALMKQEVAR